MNENIAFKMKSAARFLGRKAENESLDDCRIMSQKAKCVWAECRNMGKKTSETIQKLIILSRELCKDGVLPNDNKIIDYFYPQSLNAIEAEYLKLAITCVLIQYAVQGIRSDDKNLFKNSSLSLGRLEDTDFRLISEKLFVAEALLSEDPTGEYLLCDTNTKESYRRYIAHKSIKTGKTEKEITEYALKKAKENHCHIGRYIVPSVNGKRGYLYMIMEAVMPLASAFALGVLLKDFRISLLSFFPLWEIMRYPIESASLNGISTARLPRFSEDCEAVQNTHVLITVSTIIPSADKINELENHLEEVFLSNRTNTSKVCCLADFKGANTPTKPEDKIIIKAVTEAVNRLNQRYSGGFILAVRPRTYCKTQNEFIGRERKRGAITELIRAIKGNNNGFTLIHGDTEKLGEIKYIIALDSDTQLVFDSVNTLIAVAEHPLNRPVIRDGRVVSGYGIFVPKAENTLNTVSYSRFSALMSGDKGLTAYDSLSCERYQQLFGESIFCGKGLIDVDSYFHLLDDTLPDETVLSHDIVESGYMRAGFISDVSIIESFPENERGYYKRLHRWVRGDWQNIWLIFGKNPLNFVSRYKMLDNLRRSLNPVFSLWALIWSVIIQGNAGVFLACVSLLSAGAGCFYGTLNSVTNHGFSVLTRLYFTKSMPSALENTVRGIVHTVHLVKESIVCFFAAITAMWRLFISRKNLLEWQTSSQSNQNKASWLFMCLPSVVFGVFLCVFGLPIHRLAGLIFFADIPITLFSLKSNNNIHVKLTEKQKERLMTYASAMWGYFEELCGKDNNYLPPDNIQLYPKKIVATRTSPTNIGLMLVSFLAARDFGFITSAQLCQKLKKSLNSIEKLEKYKGNLYNWYDTSTFETVEPRFVSTVDSGNFLCCLVSLKEGLKEYISECSDFSDIVEKIEEIIDNTDLSFMYNPQRRLFHTGILPDKGELSTSYYDMYMSEARMTSYFAVAKRQVSKKHWTAMGRNPAIQGRYAGFLSWTGTMFEYFMPNLFLPALKGSATGEALYFCVYSQRKRAGRRPFGVSESSYNAFDTNGNYSYKAHGVQTLGIKCGLDEEYVASPYSSFLTLTTAFKPSMKNIARFLKLRMYGNYGFYEATDFTNNKNSKKYSVVKSYMVHHVGMSFVSVANVMNWQCMQQRFMRDRSMRGAKTLLEERISDINKTTFL